MYNKPRNAPICRLTHGPSPLRQMSTPSTSSSPTKESHSAADSTSFSQRALRTTSSPLLSSFSLSLLNTNVPSPSLLRPLPLSPSPTDTPSLPSSLQSSVEADLLPPTCTPTQHTLSCCSTPIDTEPSTCSTSCLRPLGAHRSSTGRRLARLKTTPFRCYSCLRKEGIELLSLCAEAGARVGLATVELEDGRAVNSNSWEEGRWSERCGQFSWDKERLRMVGISVGGEVEGVEVEEGWGLAVLVEVWEVWGKLGPEGFRGWAERELKV
ncbi:MAG: hypothetical protein MMC23_001994 [Stictis urceolatum]|nr:hypothetical protein [Stictis urceolata]